MPESELIQAFATEFAVDPVGPRVLAWTLPSTGMTGWEPQALGLDSAGVAVPVSRQAVEAALAAAFRQATGVAVGPSLGTLLEREFDQRRRSAEPLAGLPSEERALIEMLFLEDWLPSRQSPARVRSLDDLVRDLVGGGGATWVGLATHNDAVFALLFGAIAIVLVQFATGVGESARAFGSSLFPPQREVDDGET